MSALNTLSKTSHLNWKIVKVEVWHPDLCAATYGHTLTIAQYRTLGVAYSGTFVLTLPRMFHMMMHDPCCGRSFHSCFFRVSFPIPDIWGVGFPIPNFLNHYSMFQMIKLIAWLTHLQSRVIGTLNKALATVTCDPCHVDKLKSSLQNCSSLIG